MAEVKWHSGRVVLMPSSPITQALLAGLPHGLSEVWSSRCQVVNAINLSLEIASGGSS